MLSLILVAVALFALYHIKKITKFLNKLGSNDRFVIFEISFICLCFIVVIYAGMLIPIVNYNSNVATCNNYKNIVAQLELELDECDKNIEHFSSYSKLTDEEINTILEALSVKKSDIEGKINQFNKEIERLTPLCDDPKLYRFLLYFG